MTFLFLLGFWALSHGDEKLVLIRAPEADMVGFASWLQTNPRLLPYSQWWIHHRVKSKLRQELETRLEIAQAEFLKGSLDQARTRFAEILALEDQADWQAAERKTMAYARLRLAQLTTDLEERHSQVQAAARWGEVNLQSRLWPQPLWHSYQQALHQSVLTPFDLDLWHSGVRYLLIDGRPFEILPTTPYPVDLSRHRFTLVFDHRTVVSAFLNWEEFKAWRPSSPDLVKGTCSSHKLHAGEEFPARHQIYFADECVVGASSFSGSAPIAVSSPLLPIVGQEWKASTSQPRKTSPWLWAGVGVLAAGAVYFLSQKSESPNQPTTTVGF